MLDEAQGAASQAAKARRDGRALAPERRIRVRRRRAGARDGQQGISCRQGSVRKRCVRRPGRGVTISPLFFLLGSLRSDILGTSVALRAHGGGEAVGVVPNRKHLRRSQ